MQKIVIQTVTVLLMISSAALSQSRVGPDTVIIYTRCPPEFVPHVVVDSIVFSDIDAVGAVPQPTLGLSGIQRSVKYPDLARIAKLPGRVLIQAIIDTMGKVTKVEVIKGTSSIFDEVSLLAVRNTTFAPAQYGNHSVQSKIIIPISFTLKPKLRNQGQQQFTEFSELSLSHTPGMLRGPTYSVVLKSDGTAEYVGEARVDHIGRYKGTFDLYNFRKLEGLIKSLCLLDCVPDTRRMASDVSRDVIYVGQDGKVQRVDTGDDQDERVWGLARIVDYLASQIRWEKITPLPEKQ